MVIDFVRVSVMLGSKKYKITTHKLPPKSLSHLKLLKTKTCKLINEKLNSKHWHGISSLTLWLFFCYATFYHDPLVATVAITQHYIVTLKVKGCSGSVFTASTLTLTLDQMKLPHFFSWVMHWRMMRQNTEVCGKDITGGHNLKYNLLLLLSLHVGRMGRTPCSQMVLLLLAL